MSLEPDQYYTASLVNGLPTVTFPPKPYARKVTNIVVGNSIASSVKVYRGLLGSIPVAQNTAGNNNTITGITNLPAGQQLFVVWSAVGAGGASDAFARASFETSDSPLDAEPEHQVWTVNPVTQLVLPTGATTGLRIVLDGTTDTIKFYNAANVLVAQLDPTGLTAGNDLSNLTTANYVKAATNGPILGGPELDIQPGTSVAGNWLPSGLITLDQNSGLANEYQDLLISAPSFAPDNYNQAAAIQLGSGARDLSAAGIISMLADQYFFENHNNSATFMTIGKDGKVTITGSSHSLLHVPLAQALHGWCTAGTVASAVNGGPEVAIPAASWAAEPNGTFQNARLYRCELQYGTGLLTSASTTARVRVRKGSASIAGLELASSVWQQQNNNAFLSGPTLVFYVKNVTGADITTALSVTIAWTSGAANTVRLYGDAINGAGGGAGIPLMLTVQDIGEESTSPFTNMAVQIS